MHGEERRGMDESDVRREERMERISAPEEDMDEDMAEDMSMENEENGDSDFLDKPDDLTEDDEYSRS